MITRSNPSGFKCFWVWVFSTILAPVLVPVFLAIYVWGGVEILVRELIGNFDDPDRSIGHALFFGCVLVFSTPWAIGLYFSGVL